MTNWVRLQEENRGLHLRLREAQERLETAERSIRDLRKELTNSRNCADTAVNNGWETAFRLSFEYLDSVMAYYEKYDIATVKIALACIRHNARIYGIPDIKTDRTAV